MKLDAKAVAVLTLDGKHDAILFDERLHGFGYRLRLGAGDKLLRSGSFNTGGLGQAAGSCSGTS